MKNTYAMILIVTEFIPIDTKSIVHGTHVWKSDIDSMFMYARILLSVRTISVEPSCCPAAIEVLASNRHTLVSSTSSTNWEEGKEISIQEKREKIQTATIHSIGNCITLNLTHFNIKVELFFLQKKKLFNFQLNITWIFRSQILKLALLIFKEFLLQQLRAQ